MSGGQWVVVIRDIPANEDKLLGPFRDEERAEAAARRINGDFAARRAQDVMEAVVKWVQPGAEERDVREELIADLIEGGYDYFGPVTAWVAPSSLSAGAAATPETNA